MLFEAVYNVYKLEKLSYCNFCNRTVCILNSEHYVTFEPIIYW